MIRLATLVVFGAALATAAPCQVGAGEVGLLMSKPSGTAGTVCGRSFSCTFETTPLRPGEPVDLVVRGVFGRPFAVLVAPPQPALCASIPGIHNMLMFTPAAVPFAGVLDELDSILACPGGVATVRFTVPPSLPAGAQLLFQGLAWSYLVPAGEVPTFTPAIMAGT